MKNVVVKNTFKLSHCTLIEYPNISNQTVSSYIWESVLRFLMNNELEPDDYLMILSGFGVTILAISNMSDVSKPL